MAKQKYRVYQVVLESKEKCPAFAFQGLSVMHECGYIQPPAAFYELVYDSSIPCGDNDSDMVKLEQIYELFNVNHPSDYRGRSLSISDVVEMYDDNARRYYYCESAGFTQVQFSPALAKQKAQ